MRALPTLHIDRIERRPEDRRGVVARSELAALGRRLAATSFATPSVAALVGGWLPLESLDSPGLFVLTETRLDPLFGWCTHLGSRGYTSLLALTPNQLEAPTGVAATDLPLLSGHGVVLASCGLSGEPLVGLEVADLREELTESRRRLSEAAGYPVRTLAPEPTLTGRAFDGLVEREARRAGYSLLFTPGSVARVEQVAPAGRLAYRTREPGEDADALFDWLLGLGFSRESAQLRRLTSAPRALLERLSRET